MSTGPHDRAVRDEPEKRPGPSSVGGSADGSEATAVQGGKRQADARMAVGDAEKGGRTGGATGEDKDNQRERSADKKGDKKEGKQDKQDPPPGGVDRTPLHPRDRAYTVQFTFHRACHENGSKFG